MTCRVAPPAPPDSEARPQPRGGVLPLRISSFIASLPASKAVMSRCVCSSNTSRLLSSQSPARPCASFANSWARFANWSRISRPALGAIRSAEAAPMIPPRKNQPRYPAASFRSLAMVISLVLRKPGHEDVESLLESDRHPDELAGAREPGQPGHGPAHAVGHGVHVFRHLAHALDLLLRLAAERSHVLPQRVHLSVQRPRLTRYDVLHRLL